MTNQEQDADWKAAVEASRLKTKEEAEGRRPLNPEGTYNDCTINIKKMMRSQWDWPSGDPKYQAFIEFVCPTNDVRLTKYMTLTTRGDDECYELISKSFPQGENLLNKALPDVNGRRVGVHITWKKNKRGVDAEEWSFFRSQVSAAGAAKK